MAFIKEEAQPLQDFDFFDANNIKKIDSSMREVATTKVFATSVPVAAVSGAPEIYETSPAMSPPALTFDLSNSNGQQHHQQQQQIVQQQNREQSVAPVDTPHSCLTTTIPLANENSNDLACSPLFDTAPEDPSTWTSLFPENDNDNAIYIRGEDDSISKGSTNNSSKSPSSTTTSNTNSSSNSSISTNWDELFANSSSEALRSFLSKNSSLLAGLKNQSSNEGNVQRFDFHFTKSSGGTNESKKITDDQQSNQQRRNTAPASSKVTKEKQQPKSAEEKALLKRARNTEAARRSRARKTERLQELEKKCSALTKRNQELEMEVLRLRLLMAQKEDLKDRDGFREMFRRPTA